MSEIIHNGGLREIAVFFAMNTILLVNSILIKRLLLPGERSFAVSAAAVYIAACAQVALILTAHGAAHALSLVNAVVTEGTAFVGLGILYFYSRARVKPVPAPVPGLEFFSSLEIPVRLFAIATAVLLACFFVWAAISPPPPTDAFSDHLYFPAMWMKHGGFSVLPLSNGDMARPYYPAGASMTLLWLLLPFRDDIMCNIPQFAGLIACCAAVYALARKARLDTTHSALAALLCVFTPLMLLRTTNSDMDLVFAAYLLCGLVFMRSYIETRGTGPLVLCAASLGLFAAAKFTAPLYLAPFAPVMLYYMFNRREESQGGGIRHALVFLLVSGALCGYWYARNIVLTGNPVFPLKVSLFGFSIFPGAFGREAMLGSMFHTKRLSELRGILGFWALGRGLAVFACFSAVLGTFVFAAGGGKCEERGKMFLPAVTALLLTPVVFFVFRRFGDGAAGDALVLCACTLPAAAVALRAMRMREDAFTAVLLCFPFYFTAVFWYVNPHNTVTNCRFLIPAVALFYIFAARALSAVSFGRLLTVLAVVCAAVSAAAPDILNIPLSLAAIATGKDKEPFASYAPAVYGWLAAFFTGVLLWLAIQAGKSRARAAGVAFLTFAVFASSVFAVRNVYGNAAQKKLMWYQSLLLGNAAIMVDSYSRHLFPEGATIAWSGFDAPYSLMGAGLRNRVVYISPSGRADLRFHDFSLNRGEEACMKERGPVRDSQKVYLWQRKCEDRDRWLRALDEKGIDMLVLFPEYGRWPIENKWAISKPGRFALILNWPYVRIFVIMRETAVGSSGAPAKQSTKPVSQNYH